jgi:antitoxin Phd
MASVQLREAKAKLSALVDAAERGEATIITRHGKPAARIVPIEHTDEGRGKKKPSFAAWLLSMPGEIPVPPRNSPVRVVDFD